MNLAQWHRRVIEGRGLSTWPVRAGLRVLETIYRFGVDARNARFDRFGPSVLLDKPVISVGNITVGGTGKTPFVVYLIERLRAAGRRPAVLARGYGERAGVPNDEELLIRGRFPDLLYAAHRERERGAETVKPGAPDVFLLDDGFQYRKLKRNLNIVLIDATCPFGFEHVLPRGLLREPARSLVRADVVVITRADLVSEAELERISRVIRSHAASAPVLKCQHVVTGAEWIKGGEVSDGLRGKHVTLMSAIGNPGAFRRTVESMGATVLNEVVFPDHHSYDRSDLDQLEKAMKASSSSIVVVTEKDAVKLRELDHPVLERTAFVRVAIEFQGNDAIILDKLINECFK